MFVFKYRLLFITALSLIITPLWVYPDNLPSCRLVNAPTAGSLPSRSYFLETYLFERGSVGQRIGFGLTNLVDIGISFSGSNIIGSDRVDWQPHVGAQVHIRIVEESFKNPALSFGFDSQGEGSYISGENLNRFRTKSKGFYLVMSRNYSMLGNLGLHGGVNYSLEDDDGDKDPSFWIGLDKNIGDLIELCCEYDFATNDNENENITSDRGYLNGAVKLNLGDAFILEFDLRNILRNAKKDFTGYTEKRPEPSRELRIYYRGTY